MIRIERADLVEIAARGRGVSRRHGLLDFPRKLLDERHGFQPFARFLIQHARVLVHQIVGQDFRGQVDHPLKVAFCHRCSRFAQGIGGRGWPHQRLEVDGSRGILRFFQQLLRRLEHRIHAKDESASLQHFLGSALLEEGKGLLKGRLHPLLDGGRQRGVAEVSAHL